MELRDGQPGKLTWEILSQVFPVARSERRARTELFGELVPAAAARDDQAFYSALLERMRADSRFVQRIHAVYGESSRPKDRQKAFVRRAMKWMRARHPDLTHRQSRPDRYPLFKDGTVEREVEELMLRSLPDKEGLLMDGSDLEADWHEAVGRLKALVDMIDDATVADMDALLAECELLKELAVARAQVQDSSEEQRQSLADRIRADLSAWSTLDEVAAVCGTLDQASLAELETIGEQLGDLVTALEEQQELADRETARQADLSAAWERQELARVSELAKEVAEIQKQLEGRKDLVATWLSGIKRESGAETLQAGEEDAGPGGVQQGLPEPRPAEAAGPAEGDLHVGPGPAQEPESESEADWHPGVEPNEDSGSVQVQEPEAPEHADEPVAEDHSAGTGLGPSVRSPAEINAAMVRYLRAEQDALAWHLARLVDPDTLDVPASVARALTITPCVTGPYQVASERVGEALAQSMGDLGRLEQQDRPSTGAVRALLFASLLRPAVLAPDSSAREHLQAFSMAGELAPLAPLQQALASLGHDFTPQVEDLRALAGAERSRRAPETVRLLCEWRRRAEGATSLHQPTTQIFREMLKDSGRIGSLVDAVERGSEQAPALVKGWTGTYLANRPEVEALVAELEREGGRPSKDAIIGKAMDWIYRKIQEGAELLADWLEAHRADQELDDHNRKALQPKVTQLDRLVSEALEAWPSAADPESLEEVARTRLSVALERMKALLSGTEDSAPLRVSVALGMPLRLLPSVCIPRTEGFEPGSDFAEERRRQEQALVEALVHDATEGLADYRVALRERLAEGAVLAAGEIVDHLDARGELAPGEREDWDDELADAVARERAAFLAGAEALRLGLSTLYNLDLSNGDELRAALETADALVLAVKGEEASDGDPIVSLPAGDERRPGVPADFPEARAVLGDLRGLQQHVEKAIRAHQQERLEKIAEEQPALQEAITALLPTLDNRDPTAVEDLIASVQAGQGIPALEDDRQDLFQEFYPGFVNELVEAKLARGHIDAALMEGKQIGPLDFSRLDDGLRRGGRHLLQSWRQVENLLEKRSREWKPAVLNVLEGLGFTSVSVSSESAMLTGKLRSTSFTSQVPVSEGWFLPPEFGSLANGRYRLFLCTPEQDSSAVVNEMAKGPGDQAAVVLCFGKLGRARRREFARAMRGRRQRALLVDEVLVLFLVSREAGRFQTLVECASPFGFVQPYTTDPGSIPREMFFGRKDEIARIHARSSDGCLVYGGRQLGKSALLNHVRKMYHAPSQGQVVCYRSCDSLGLESEPAAFIWRFMAQKLEGIVEVPPGDIDAEQFSKTIEGWLNDDPARRILMLLDETDNFMSSEARLSYRNLTQIKDLMVRTQWRFKVVFAGLHNVRRAWKAPNTPLAHLGDPICVGPLSTTPDNRTEARRLVVAPVRAAGFEFERPEIGWDILARVNHYPSLVQVFCKELLAELHGAKVDQAPTGPRWRVSRAMVFEGPRYRQINEAIRGKFRLTLDLDPRYDLIANVLAELRFEESDKLVLRDGLEVKDLHARVLRLWPASLERLRLDEFRAILDEMVDLGVLSLLGKQGNRYGLRTAQVAHMLGNRDEVEHRLLHIMDMEPRVDYDAALFFRRLEPEMPERRSVLSDAQLEQLFGDSKPGSRVVVTGNGHHPAAFADALVAAGRSWVGGGVPRVAELHAGDRLKFREAIRRLGKANAQAAILVIPEQAGWDVGWMDWVDGQPEVKRGAVVPVFVASVQSFQQAGSTPWGARPVFVPQPWGDKMLRAWLAECDGSMLDHEAMRSRLLAGAGGLPDRIIEATRELVDRARSGTVDLAEFLRAWEDEQRLDPAEFGLGAGLSELLMELEDMDRAADFDTFVELQASEGGRAEDGVKADLRFLDQLGVIELDEGVRIRVTDLGRLLKKGLDG